MDDILILHRSDNCNAGICQREIPTANRGEDGDAYILNKMACRNSDQRENAERRNTLPAHSIYEHHICWRMDYSSEYGEYMYTSRGVVRANELVRERQYTTKRVGETKKGARQEWCVSVSMCERRAKK